MSIETYGDGDILITGNSIQTYKLLATMANDVHEHGWQWRPAGKDTAFAPPFGTIRVCGACGCPVAGGPTACARCAEAGT